MAEMAKKNQKSRGKEGGSLAANMRFGYLVVIELCPDEFLCVERPDSGQTLDRGIQVREHRASGCSFR